MESTSPCNQDVGNLIRIADALGVSLRDLV